MIKFNHIQVIPTLLELAKTIMLFLSHNNPKTTVATLLSLSVLRL